MGRVGVVTDSIACLSEELRQAYGIEFASIHLILDGEDLRDGVDITAEEYFARMGDVINHTTSAPSPGEWLAEMEKSVAAGHEELLVVTLSGKLSNAVDTARVAAGLMPVRVEVVDTETAAAAEGLMVRRLAEMAAEGMSLDDLVAAARRLTGHYHLVATLSGLARLAHSGRMPAALARMGDSFSLKPMIGLQGGVVRPVGVARSLAGGVERMTERLLAALPPDRPSRATVTHALLEEEALKLADRLRVERPSAEVDVVLFTPVMGASTGPVVGVAWEDPDIIPG